MKNSKFLHRKLVEGRVNCYDPAYFIIFQNIARGRCECCQMETAISWKRLIGLKRCYGIRFIVVLFFLVLLQRENNR